MAELFLENNPADERCSDTELNEASMKAKGDKPASTGRERSMAERRAEDEALKNNMERLRALRLEREAAQKKG
jgi:hypothetical protein